MRKTPFENIMGKGENAGYQHFLLFPQCLFTLSYTNFNFSLTFISSSANAFNLDQSTIFSSGKWLNSYMLMINITIFYDNIDLYEEYELRGK